MENRMNRSIYPLLKTNSLGLRPMTCRKLGMCPAEKLLRRLHKKICYNGITITLARERWAADCRSRKMKEYRPLCLPGPSSPSLFFRKWVWPTSFTFVREIFLLYPHCHEIKTAPEQRSWGQKRRLLASDDDSSLRKRRQLGTDMPLPLESSRIYPYSRFDQNLTRKRDRDFQVRTGHEQSFWCSKFESWINSKSDVNKHVWIVHDLLRPYQCPFCPKMLSERNRGTFNEKSRQYFIRSVLRGLESLETVANTLHHYICCNRQSQGLISGAPG